jgi:hypothetical protein
MPATRNQATVIGKLIGARLPAVDGPIPSAEWLFAYFDKIGCDRPEAESIAGLLRSAIEELGGCWRSRHTTREGKPSAAATTELAELVGIRVALQQCVGLRRRPFSTDADLWEAIFTELFPDEDTPPDLRSTAYRCLAHVTATPEDSLPSDLFAPTGVPSKVAQQEVLSYLERHASGDVSVAAPTEASDDDSQSDTAEDAAADLALTTSIDGTPLNQHLPSLMESIDEGDLVLDPPWQRGDIWSLAKKRSLIESLLLGIPLPSIILHWERDRTITVIDGKQRLTAIHQFFRDEWSLGRYPVNAPLADVAGHCFSGLPDWARRKIRDTQVPVLKFQGLVPRVLYRIFELYNVTGIRLNAVEIRNAVYHAHPVHHMLFDLAGEREDVDCYLSDEQEQEAFTSLLRTTVSPSGQPARYATLDFLCRYLAYSRVPPSPRTGQFVAESTARIVRCYFESPISQEDPHAVANEIKDAFFLAGDLFHAARVDPFAVPSGPRLRFNRLRATTSLILAAMFMKVRAIKELPDDEARECLVAVNARVPYPDKQQTQTIWRFQAESVCECVSTLALTDAEVSNAGLDRLVHTMRALIA